MQAWRIAVDRLLKRESPYSPHHEHAAIAVTQLLGDHPRLDAEHVEHAARAKCRPTLGHTLAGKEHCLPRRPHAGVAVAFLEKEQCRPARPVVVQAGPLRRASRGCSLTVQSRRTPQSGGMFWFSRKMFVGS